MKVPLIGSPDFWDDSRRKSDSFILKPDTNNKANETCDADVLSNIDPVYFNSSDFDFTRFELEVSFKLLFALIMYSNYLVSSMLVNGLVV